MTKGYYPNVGVFGHKNPHRCQWGTLQKEEYASSVFFGCLRRRNVGRNELDAGHKKTPPSPVGRKGKTLLSVWLDAQAYEEVAVNTNLIDSF
jgi:hypothetical protein